VVLVALIGDQWAVSADEQGRRRLDDPDDFVRFEVQAALERGVLVIPVLVDGAKPLRQEQLPAELHKLARLNALELSYGRYEYDADHLFNRIQRVLTAASSTGIAPESSATANVQTLATSYNVRRDNSALGQAAQKDAEVSRENQAHRIRLLIDAKQGAESITDLSSAVSRLPSPRSGVDGQAKSAGCT
jgi:hypothetical protein